MVSFICDICQETLKKQKLDAHFNRCPDAFFSCVDCSTTFQGTDYRGHTSCISEAEKYQKSLYKPTQKQLKKEQQQKEQKVQKPVTNEKETTPSDTKAGSQFKTFKSTLWRKISKTQKKKKSINLERLMKEVLEKSKLKSDTERKTIENMFFKSFVITPTQVNKAKTECVCTIELKDN